MLRAELPRLLKKLGAVSLLDAPCGDAGWINQADLDVRYAGVDIVPSLIEALQARAAAGEINGEYRLADITRIRCPDAMRSCAATLSCICLCQYRRAVANFRTSGAAWMIATTFPEWQNNGDAGTATGVR